MQTNQFPKKSIVLYAVSAIKKPSLNGTEVVGESVNRLGIYSPYKNLVLPATSYSYSYKRGELILKAKYTEGSRSGYLVPSPPRPPAITSGIIFHFLGVGIWCTIPVLALPTRNTGAIYLFFTNVGISQHTSGLSGW